MKSFDIYFSGQILGTHDLAEVKASLGKQFKLSGTKLEALFSGKPVRIKSGIDVEAAGKYREVFRRAGAIIDIVPTGQKPVPSTARETPQETTPPTEKASDLELLPARSGSLIDIAEASPPPVEADITDYSLAPAGALFPEPKPVAPAEIDTGHLHAEPANTGSLEEFAEQKQPVAIPDISSMEVSPPGEAPPGASTKDNATPPIPDTSHMEAAPPNTGSLEEFSVEKRPTPIPDISGIKLAE